MSTKAARKDSAATTAAPLPLAVLVLAVTAYLVHGVVTMDVPATATTPGPRFFPVVVAVVSGLVGVALLVQHLVVRRRGAHGSAAGAAPVAPADTAAPSDTADAATTGAPPATQPAGEDDDRINWSAVLAVGGAFLLFTLILEPVGWLVSAAVLFYGVLIGLGSRRWLVDAGVALVFSAVVQLAFSGGLGLPLPAGILGGS